MWRKILIFLIFFIYITLGIPIPKSLNWEEIANQLSNYNDSLLNEEIVTDLKECHLNNTAKDKYLVEFICPKYIELVLQINKTDTNKIFTKDLIKKELDNSANSTTNITEFCDRLKTNIPNNTLLTDLDGCKLVCLDINGIQVFKKILKPICKITDMMIIYLNNKTSIVNKQISIGQNIAEKTSKSIIVQNAQTKLIINEKNVDEGKKKENATIDTSQKNDDNVVAQEPKILPNDNIKTTSTKDSDLNNKQIASQPLIAPLKPQKIQEPTKSNEIIENAPAIEPNINNKKSNEINDDLKLTNGYIDQNEIDAVSNDYVQEDEEDKLKSPLTSKLPDKKQNNLDFDNKLQQQLEIRNEFGNDHKVILNDPFYEKSGSNFFTYLLIAMFGCILLYVAYHNKSKILALLLEGRRGQKGRGGRRKHTAAYRKLDSNLEEAISSPSSARSTQIIY